MSLCQDCHAGCCRSFAVPVTGADVLKITGDLKLEFWDFACRWEDRDGIIARKYAPHFRFQDDPETPYVICLKHAVSQQFPGTTRCLFLKEGSTSEGPKARSSCGVYHSRPSACRAFPLKFANSGDLPILYDVPAKGREGHEKAYDLCPRQWELSDIDPIESVQELAVAKYEMEFFTQIAQVWNRNPGDWMLFPQFLEIVYENRVTREQDATEIKRQRKAA